MSVGFEPIKTDWNIVSIWLFQYGGVDKTWTCTTESLVSEASVFTNYTTLAYEEGLAWINTSNTSLYSSNISFLICSTISWESYKDKFLSIVISISI